MEKNFNEVFDNISFDSFKFEDNFTANEGTSRSRSRNNSDCECSHNESRSRSISRSRSRSSKSRSRSRSSKSRSSRSHSISSRRNGRIAVTAVLGCREREPLGGVTVVLFRVVGCSLEFVSAKVTNPNGRAVFNNLRNGIYKVAEIIRGCIFEEPIFLPTDQVTIDENNREFDIIIINKIRGCRSRSRSRSISRSRSRSRSISISRSNIRGISRIRRRRRRVDVFDEELFILIILFLFCGCGFGFGFGFGFPGFGFF